MTALERLGYYFDNDEVLRTKTDNETFKFTTQEEYEELGEAVEEEVYRLLETRCGLNRLPVKPADSHAADSDVSFVFASEDFDKRETLLVLIHGSGVVRAGQWARRLIINENLRSGTQIPFIERAIKNGWGVIVMNTNHNEGKGRHPLQFSDTPSNHTKSVWSFFVKPSSAKKIYTVAHSRGGSDFWSILFRNIDDERMSLVCLTDTGDFIYPRKNSERTRPLIAVNFVVSGTFDSPAFEIGKEFDRKKFYKLHAGTKVHESSSYQAMNSIFHIFENDMNEENFIEIMKEAKRLVKKENSPEPEEKNEAEEPNKEADSDEKDKKEEEPESENGHDETDKKTDEVDDGIPEQKKRRIE